MADSEPRATTLEELSLRSSDGRAEVGGGEESLPRLAQSVLKVAYKGMVVGVGLHAGVKLLAGVNSGRALSK